MKSFLYNDCFKFSLSILPGLFFTFIYLVFSLVLNSCHTGATGKYQFQPESMHWLQFRGPNASGIARENADPPVHFSADTNLLWKTEILPGWSSPCVVNEKLFLTGFNDVDSLLFIMAIYRKNGEILWKDSISPDGFYDIHPINGYANPTVASNGEKIFAYFPNYGLIAYDMDGARSWCYPNKKVGEIRWGGASSPVVLDSMLIMDVTSYYDPRIVALDCETGDSLWVNRDPDHRWGSVMSRATPVVWHDLIILHHSNEIIAYNVHTGKTEWWLPTLTSSVGTPVIRDDILFVNTWSNLGEESVRGNQASFDELLKELDVNENNKLEREEFPDGFNIFQRPESPEAPESSMAVNNESSFAWFDEDGDGSYVESEWNAMWEFWITNFGDHGMLAIPLIGSGERSAGDILWKINEDTPETPSPLVVHENVLFIKNGGILTVVKQESGEVVYKNRIGATGSYLASPMLAGNRIYACSFNGTVTVLSADDFSVLKHNRLKEKIAASPVAIDDVLYIRTDKHLFAFREI
jgi:outer membrane protein assembly factor BamB